MTAHELARELLAGPDIEVCIPHHKYDYCRTVMARPALSVYADELAVRSDGDYQLVDGEPDRDGRRRVSVLLIS